MSGVRLKGMSLSAGSVLAMGWVGYPWRGECVWCPPEGNESVCWVCTCHGLGRLSLEAGGRLVSARRDCFCLDPCSAPYCKTRKKWLMVSDCNKAVKKLINATGIT